MMERMIGLFKKNFSKKRKGFSFMEVLLALVLIVAMSVGAFFALNTAQQTRKMAQMNNDMDAIVNGLLAYEQLNINGSLPATLQACSAGLTADQSIDGASHTNLLKWTKSTTAANAPGTALLILGGRHMAMIVLHALLPVLLRMHPAQLWLPLLVIFNNLSIRKEEFHVKAYVEKKICL